MASLNETAHFSRIVIKWGAIFLVVMMVGRFALGVLGTVYNALFPDAPPPPNVCYGIIPPLEFPVSEEDSLNYQLELPTGAFPVFVDRMEVFEYQLERPNLLAVDRAIGEADRMGFDEEPRELSTTEYLWTKNDGIPGSLSMNVYDGTFDIKYDWTVASDFLINKQLIYEEQGRDKLDSFLQSPQLLPDDLEGGPYNVTFLQASGRAYQEAESLSEADFLKYDLFRTPVDDIIQVVTVDAVTGVVSALLSTNPQQAWLVDLEYNYFPLNYEDECFYPLKPVSKAWDELLQGKGHVASLEDGVTDVVIRQVELGYFDAFDKQPYMQPVYIFRGDNEFVGYVQAVIDPTLTPTGTP